MNYTDAFGQPFIDMWARVLEYVPLLAVAFLVLILGLIVSPLLGGLIEKTLRFLKIDTIAEQSGVTTALAEIGMDFSFARVIGLIVKYVLFVVFLNIIVEILGLTQITALIDDLIRYIPQVIVAVVLFGAGLTFGNVFETATKKMTLATSLSDRDGALLGVIGKYAIVVFAAMAALVQLNVAQELVQILFAGIMLATALSFGLGSRIRVEQFWKDVTDKDVK